MVKKSSRKSICRIGESYFNQRGPLLDTRTARKSGLKISKGSVVKMKPIATTRKRMNRFWHFNILVMLVLLACFIFFSSKAGGLLLTASIEPAATPISAAAGKAPQAIVVLTGGYGRNMEAARLHRETGLPVLASGGDGEAVAIKKHLKDDFHVPVRWTEGDSLNTEQNALFTAKILAQENIQTIILVTHALHMRRARRMFEGWGLEVIPAPTDF